MRPLVSATIKEFMLPPILYVKNDFFETYEGLKAELPEHELDTEENKTSFSLIFKDLDDREAAKIS